MSGKNIRKPNYTQKATGQHDAPEDPGHLANDGSPADGTGPEIDPQGSDQESNVTGRSKPASDGVAQHERDKRQSNG